MLQYNLLRLLSACRYMRQRTKCTQRLCSCCHLWQCPTHNTTSKSWLHWTHCCQWQSISTLHTMGHSPHRLVWKWSPGLNSSNPSYYLTTRSVISYSQSFGFSVAQYIHVLPLCITCENRYTKWCNGSLRYMRVQFQICLSAESEKNNQYLCTYTTFSLFSLWKERPWVHNLEIKTLKNIPRHLRVIPYSHTGVYRISEELDAFIFRAEMFSSQFSDSFFLDKTCNII